MYKLKKFKGNVFIVTIVADANDAQYVTTIEHYDEEEFLEIEPYLKDLMINGSVRGSLREWASQSDASEWIEIPWDGWDGYCHSLESISIEYIDENSISYSVEIDLED